MRASLFRNAPFCTFAVLTCVTVICSAPLAQDATYRFEELGEGIHLLRPVDATYEGVNSLVVERDDGLLVVSAQPSPQAAREMLAAIDTRLGRPVRYLALPHSHADAAGGASAFDESVLVVGTVGCREALEDDAYDFGAESRVRAGASSTWKEPPRRLPTLLIQSRAVLSDSRNTVELLPHQAAHSPGDLLVRVPGVDVLFVGALVFPNRDPYAGDATITSWMSALTHLVRQAPRFVVGLRGPALTVDQVRVQRDSFAWLRGQVEYGFADQLAFDEIRERVLATEGFAEKFSLDSPFLSEFVDRVIEQSHATRAKFNRP